MAKKMHKARMAVLRAKTKKMEKARKKDLSRMRALNDTLRNVFE